MMENPGPAKAKMASEGEFVHPVEAAIPVVAG